MLKYKILKKECVLQNSLKCKRYKNCKKEKRKKKTERLDFLIGCHRFLVSSVPSPAPSPPTIDPQTVFNFVAEWMREKESYLYLPAREGLRSRVHRREADLAMRGRRGGTPVGLLRE
jgi:hypothetical protein